MIPDGYIPLDGTPLVYDPGSDAVYLVEGENLTRARKPKALHAAQTTAQVRTLQWVEDYMAGLFEAEEYMGWTP